MLVASGCLWSLSDSLDEAAVEEPDELVVVVGDEEEAAEADEGEQDDFNSCMCCWPFGSFGCGGLLFLFGLILEVVLNCCCKLAA